MRREGSFLARLFRHIFYIHLLLIFILVVLLIVRELLSLSPAHTHHFKLKDWCMLVLPSTGCAGIIAFAWQAFASFNPSRTLKTTFLLSPILTCAFGILLVSIGTPGSLAVSFVALVFSILQSLYACWVNPRLEHSSKILTVSTAYHPLKVKISVALSLVVSTLYSSFMMAGVGAATANGTTVDMVFIILIIASMTWTTQIIKNMIQVTVSHIKYMQFTCGLEVDYKTAVKCAAKYSMGNICIGSILVPVLGVIRGSARAVSLISGGVDEFMFSCADCCSGVAERIVAYGNRWGFVHVGVYNKGIVQASRDTWEMFRRVGMEHLINCDLTSSFCFLSGVAAGSICGLLGGNWALVIHRNYATEVCIYGFLTGYLTNRVAMAWVQASIMAYYVAYAEDPQNQQFEATIPAYIRELQRSQL